MAVWQFQLKLVPRAVAAAHGLLPGGHLTDSFREEVAWWRDRSLTADALQPLYEILPPGKTWTEELEVLGDLETTCVTILRESGVIVEVHARLDLRTFSAEAGKALLDFARRLECLLLTDENKALNPDSTALAEAIKTSPAYKIVKDPDAFLFNLTAGKALK